MILTAAPGRRFRRQDHLRWTFASMAVLSLVASWGCGRETPAPPPHVVATVDPAQALRQMSDTLAHANRLTFKATRRLDPALAESTGMPVSSAIEVAVSRPGMVRGRSVSNDDARTFYADGKTITLVDERIKLYASEPLGGTIDEMVDALDDRFGFAPPLAEFVLNDPYKRFSRLVQRSVHRGQETIGGTSCEHLTLAGEVADAEVWIARDTHLPRRFVATFKDREGAPALTLDFSDWNLAATVDDSVFAFHPAPDVAKTTMVAVADLASAVANTAAGKDGSQ